MKTPKATERQTAELTPVQARALQIIKAAEKEKRPLHASELTEYLGVSQPRALRIVRDLELKGAVVRDDLPFGLARPIRVVKRKDSQ